mmetsp:Transcript_52039/g.106078  ORF Transcript_52039/g.106078 Transcript_52039/m.106078 type:complete len:548 (-) Transcript_52039:639-2282(-)
MGASSSRQPICEIQDTPYLDVIENIEFLDWRRRPNEETGMSLSVNEQTRLEREQTSTPIVISAHVCISDARGVKRFGTLKYMGVTHALNVGGLTSPNSSLFAQSNIQYKSLDIGKELCNFKECFKEARQFITGARSAGGVCVVYCANGYDRSGLIVVADLMLTEKMTVLEAVATVRQKRGNALLSDTFCREHLVALARKQDLLGAKPGDPGSYVALSVDEARPASTASGRNRRNSASSGASANSWNSSFRNSFGQKAYKQMTDENDRTKWRFTESYPNYQTERDAPLPIDIPYLEAMRDPACLDWKLRVDLSTGHLPSAEEQAVIERTQKSCPVHISDILYIADARSANRVGRLKFLGITHVLNLGGPDSAPTCIETYAEAQILYKMIHASTRDGYPTLEKHLRDVMEFITSAKNAGGKCLLYCASGNEVSVVLAAAHLLLTEDTTVLPVVAKMRLCRGNGCLANEWCQEQLVALARKENLLGVRPGETGSGFPVPNPQPRRLSTSSTSSLSDFRKVMTLKSSGSASAMETGQIPAPVSPSHGAGMV